MLRGAHREYNASVNKSVFVSFWQVRNVHQIVFTWLPSCRSSGFQTAAGPVSTVKKKTVGKLVGLLV
jgi:hypothetical protein